MGHINIKLADLICEKGKSKNKVCYNCEVQRTQLNNYCNNKISRVDLSLLARICKYLKCDISSILEYVKDEEDFADDFADEEESASDGALTAGILLTIEDRPAPEGGPAADGNHGAVPLEEEKRD